jgi:hypothetical protein
LCKEVVNLDEVHHLAQYNFGTPDFSIDVLDQVDQESYPAKTDASHRSADVGLLGRQLHYMMHEVGTALAECDSGRLIRAVFDVGAGALLYYEIRPGEYLVGLALGASRVPAADKAMAESVRKIRLRLSLPDENPGGFTEDESQPDGLASVNAAILEPVDLTSLKTSRSGSADDTDDAFLKLASAEILRGSLHFVARFERSAWTSFADTLDDARLRDFFTKISPRRRRVAYQEIGQKFYALSGSVDRALYSIIGKRTLRTILDVEEGALYVRHRGRDEHLLGVTLVQRWEQSASDHFDNLVRRYDEASQRRKRGLRDAPRPDGQPAEDLTSGS